jgi:hypothetical protein
MRAIALAFATTCLLAAPGAIAEPPPAPAPVPVPTPAVKEKAPETFVSISVRVVEATPRAVRSLRLLEMTRRPGDVPTYDPVALGRRIDCWSRAGHAKAISAPRIMAAPGQTATVTVGEDVAYVEDFEIEISMGPVVANPVIGTVFDGLHLECTSTLAPGGVSVLAKLSLSDVLRPIPEFETTVPNWEAKVRIQLPEVNIRRVERRLFLTPGRATLLADLPPALTERNGRRVMAWIEAHATVDPILTKLTQEQMDQVR